MVINGEARIPSTEISTWFLKDCRGEHNQGHDFKRAARDASTGNVTGPSAWPDLAHLPITPCPGLHYELE